MKKELTIRAVILGLLLSVIMGAANVYLGLKAGMTVSASIPAAVLAAVILRGFFKNGTILEANQVQTAASAGESLAAGIIFTMPAMILIGAWKEFNFVITTLIAFTGGLLGILFMIPMRRIFVINPDKELHFPEAVACAEVLKAGNTETGKTGMRSIVQGAAAGFVYKVFSGFIPLFNASLEGAARIGNRIFYFGTDISPALVAVGVIVGLQVSLLIGIGGALGWLVGIPLLSGHAEGMTALDGAWFLWSKQIRYIGVGCMAVGGISSIWRVRGGIMHAVKELMTSGKKQREENEQLPTGGIVLFSVLAVLLVFGIYYVITGDVAITFITGCIMVIMAFFFTAVASYIVGLVGNSNSPVSGMTITTVLFTGVLLTVFGFSGIAGMTAVLCVAAVVCCAACTAGDVCNDLRTGFMVGASPRKQQIMQIAGIAVACLVMAPVLQLLHTYTPGGIGGKELPAPQAALFAGLAGGFFGKGELRWDLVGTGAAIGIILLFVDTILIRVKSRFRLHLMPVAVGIYLPFLLAVPIVAGGIIAYGTNRQRNKGVTDGKVLFASGAIAGESLTGVGIAASAALGISRIQTGIGGNVLTASTVIAALGLVGVFYHFSRSQKKVSS
jgi:putative OPT family oligopeptide transporter